MGGFIKKLSCILSFMAIFLFHPLIASWPLASSISLLDRQNITWVNNEKSFNQTVHFSDGSIGRFILFQEEESNPHDRKCLGFGFGFYCQLEDMRFCYLTIFIVEMQNDIILATPPQLVWLVNDKNPVRENATLTLANDGALILWNADGGDYVWGVSALPSITGMCIQKNGNLLLFNESDGVVWQSFESPVDTLLLGQSVGQADNEGLIARSYSEKLSEVGIHLKIDDMVLSAYVGSTQYLNISTETPRSMSAASLHHVSLYRENLTFYFTTLGPLYFEVPYSIPSIASTRFLRLDTDGGPRIYGWDTKYGWRVVYVFLDNGDECQFPLKCGEYGVCMNNQCDCPKAVDGKEYFSAANSQFPSLGCNLIGSSSTQMSFNNFELVDFGKLSYYSYFDPNAMLPDIKIEDDCKRVCSHSSSCAAAFFCQQNQLEGKCYQSSYVLSIMGSSTTHYSRCNSSAYIKVQIQSPSRSKWLVYLLTLVILPLPFIFILVLWKKGVVPCRKANLLQLPHESPVSFSYHDLFIATRKFSVKLGGGGFGDVFKGELYDGTLVAVKRLDNNGQGMKEFLAEVQTIGKLHHINLVRLVGFCTEKSHRLLVYEFMSNGSLEKWIFKKNKGVFLKWNTRCKIILDIAKGLAYLHEECRQRIAHFDVKPHNILLDTDFSAKLSDFGLSKLIDRNKSQATTFIRGTPGYLAPEWQHLRVTVKADVYSFGVVLVEVVTGKKFLDYSRTESDVHFLSLLQKKAAEDRLMDIVEYEIDDMEFDRVDCIKMLRLGLKCLASDPSRRPLMSTVAKVLGKMGDFKPEKFSYNLSQVGVPVLSSIFCVSPLPEASVLSGPR